MINARNVLHIICALVLGNSCDKIYVKHIIYPPVEAYRISTRNNVSLKPTYLLERIVEIVKDSDVGIMLIHNHNSFLPLFSSVDRQANKSFFRFLKKNNLGIIGGSAVYASNRISYVTNCIRLKNRYLVKLRHNNLYEQVYHYRTILY